MEEKANESLKKLVDSTSRKIEIEQGKLLLYGGLSISLGLGLGYLLRKLHQEKDKDQEQEENNRNYKYRNNSGNHVRPSKDLYSSMRLQKREASEFRRSMARKHTKVLEEEALQYRLQLEERLGSDNKLL